MKHWTLREVEEKLPRGLSPKGAWREEGKRAQVARRIVQPVREHPWNSGEGLCAQDCASKEEKTDRNPGYTR